MPLARAVTVAFLAGTLCLVTSHVFAAEADIPLTSDTAWPTTAWETSTAEAQGLNSGMLAQLVDTVGTRQQDSLLITRHGRIVAEAYYAPYAADIPHDLRSVTKSVIGTLTAIEVQNGMLDSVDHPILDLFPDKSLANIDDNKRAMTVQSLLDMTSGIAWREKAYTPDETIMQMYQSPDRTAFVLNQPMSDAPGTHFYYNSGNPYVLSAVISRKTGQNAFDFAKTMLFGPLGISDAAWGEPDAQGVTDGESRLYLTPRDMAKIGYLYLRGGVWEGKRIIPSTWVDRARRGKVSATFGFHYANLWWSMPEKGAFMALGRHSQMILVLPDQDIVATMTGAMRDDEYYPVTRLIDDIVKTVKADAVLPADPVARSLLAASIRKAATEQPSPVGDTPALAKALSNKTYRLDANPAHVKTISLNLAAPDPTWGFEISVEGSDQTTRFGGPIGLDGLFRRNQRQDGHIDAVKGHWLNERTFVVERRILGVGATQQWTLGFDGKQIQIDYHDTDGDIEHVHGEQMP